MAGYYKNVSNKYVAAYWQNNAAGQVDLYNDTNWEAQGHGIFVDGDDVYVAGFYNEGTQSACYWKNNEFGLVDLYTTGTSAGYSLSVAE